MLGHLCFLVGGKDDVIGGLFFVNAWVLLSNSSSSLSSSEIDSFANSSAFLTTLLLPESNFACIFLSTGSLERVTLFSRGIAAPIPSL